MVEMRGLFGNLNNTLNNLPLSGNLGLLTTGVSLLEGQPIGQAVRSGLQTYQGLSSIDEERKRKDLLQKLISEGGFTQEEQALIAATPSQNQASVALQIRAQKAAAANKPKQATFSILSPEETKALGFQEGDILQRNNLTQDINVLRSAPKPGKPQDSFEILSADQAEALGFAKGSIVERNTVTNDYNVIQSPQETPTTFQYLTKEQKINLGFDENSVVQVNTQTKATKVVKEAPKQNETFKLLSADEVKSAGFKEGTIVQQSNLSGKNTVLEQAPNVVSTRKTLTKAELLAQGFNEGDVVQRDEITQALFVIRSASAPKNTSLVNLVSQQDVTIDGRTIKAGTVFALDQTTQQAEILQAGKQGAILAPSKVENITGGADTVDQPPAISPVSPIEIETAAGGDVAGFAKDFFNIAGGFLMFGEPATTRRDERSNLAALQNAVLPGLVRSISSTGAVRTQEAAQQLIPNPFDNDNKMASKVNSLIPVLQQKLQEADNVLKSPGKITASQRTLATQITSTYPQIISALQISKDRYEKKNTKSDVQTKADEILKKVK